MLPSVVIVDCIIHVVFFHAVLSRTGLPGASGLPADGNGTVGQPGLPGSPGRKG